MDTAVCIKCGMPLIDLADQTGLCTKCKDRVKKTLTERASVKGPTRGKKIRVYIPILDKSRKLK